MLGAGRLRSGKFGNYTFRLISRVHFRVPLFHGGAAWSLTSKVNRIREVVLHHSLQGPPISSSLSAHKIAKMIKFLVVLGLFYTMAYGMDCSLGTSESALEKYIRSCPALFSSSDEKYCCPKDGGGFTCCTLTDFILQWLIAFWPIILLVLLASALLSCICCCLRQCRSR